MGKTPQYAQRKNTTRVPTERHRRRDGMAKTPDKNSRSLHAERRQGHHRAFGQPSSFDAATADEEVNHDEAESLGTLDDREKKAGNSKKRV